MLWLTARERVALVVLTIGAALGIGLNLYRLHRDRVTVQIIHPAERARWDEALDDARRVSLNTATASELERLPGIGPRLATRIVTYRSAHGRFASLEELRAVDGIGPALLARLRELVTL